MKNLAGISKAVIVMLLAGFMTACQLQTNQPVSQKISGAYEALNFLGAAMTYPSGHIPENAHYHAWVKMNKETGIKKSKPEDRWTSIGPTNFSGRMLTLAFNPQNPNTIYSGSASGGLWKSTTQGIGESAWTRVKTGFPVLGVSTICFAPGDSMTMYIGTGEVYNSVLAGTGAAYRNTRGSYGIGILKSNDGGKTWEKSLDWTYRQNEGVWDIGISQTDPNILYAATTDGVYKSSDAGNSWQRVHPVIMANSLVVHPDDPDRVVVGSGNFNSDDAGIYKTEDGGTSWDRISENIPETFNGKIQLANNSRFPDLIYASIGNGFGGPDGATWTLRSENFGSNWELVSTQDYSRWQGWFAHDLDINPENPDEVIAAGIRVWQSQDGGHSFDTISTGGVGFSSPPIAGPDGPPSYVHSDVHDVIYHPSQPDQFFIASDGGIHTSLDGGKSFESRNGGLQTVQFYNGTSSSQLDSEFFVGGLQDNGSIAYKGDEIWRRVSGGDGSWTAVDPNNDDDILLSWQGLNMLRTTNGGETVVDLPRPAFNENVSFIAPFVTSNTNPLMVYAGMSKVYVSEDRGTSWHAPNNNNLDGFNPILSMAVSRQDHRVVYAATAPTTIFGGRRGQVFVSRNSGRTWTQISTGLPARFPMDMAVDPLQSNVAYIAFSGFGTGHVYKTVDYGQSWMDISADLPDVPTNAIAIDPRNGQHVFVGNDLGVFQSLDGGVTWSNFNEGLPEAIMVFDLNIAGEIRKLRLASHGNGAYERDLPEAPLIFSSSSDLDMVVRPNPASEQLQIHYNVATEDEYQLLVFDIIGRLVSEPLAKYRLPGEYSSVIDVRDFPAGTYLVRLSSEAEQVVKKLVVAR